MSQVIFFVSQVTPLTFIYGLRLAGEALFDYVEHSVRMSQSKKRGYTTNVQNSVCRANLKMKGSQFSGCPHEILAFHFSRRMFNDHGFA